MTKAHAYLRVSGKGQVQGDGFTRQLKAVHEYTATHDIRIVNVFREKGVTGAKESAYRPAWSELMTALHANGVQVVIIEKLDRLARDLMMQETIIGDLRKHGFEPQEKTILEAMEKARVAKGRQKSGHNADLTQDSDKLESAAIN